MPCSMTIVADPVHAGNIYLVFDGARQKQGFPNMGAACRPVGQAHHQVIFIFSTEPGIFDPIQIESAKSKGYNLWEQVVEDSAEGKNKDANTASLQMLMRNKFSWDKEEKGSDNKPSDPIKVVIADTKDLDANDRVFAQPSQITPGSDSST